MLHEVFATFLLDSLVLLYLDLIEESAAHIDASVTLRLETVANRVDLLLRDCLQ